MADRGAQHPTYTHTSAPLQPRRGPGAVAWVVLAVFGGVAALLVVAMAAGSYAGTLISALALLALAVPTIILRPCGSRCVSRIGDCAGTARTLDHESWGG